MLNHFYECFEFGGVHIPGAHEGLVNGSLQGEHVQCSYKLGGSRAVIKGGEIGVKKKKIMGNV